MESRLETKPKRVQAEESDWGPEGSRFGTGDSRFHNGGKTVNERRGPMP